MPNVIITPSGSRTSPHGDSIVPHVTLVPLSIVFEYRISTIFGLRLGGVVGGEGGWDGAFRRCSTESTPWRGGSSL